MTKVEFTFYSTILLLTGILSGLREIPLETQLIAALIIFAVVGIPHGALDHVIYMKEKKVGNLRFYSFYIGIMLLYFLLWIYFPQLCLILFLCVSAYHFGQSQLTQYQKIPPSKRMALYFFWGLSVISGLIYYNAPETSQIITASLDYEKLKWLISPQLYTFILPGSSIITFLLLLQSVYNKEIELEAFTKEVFLLGLIHFSFFILPVILAFTLYFGIIHSTKTLLDEFNYMQQRKVNFGFKSFLWSLLPLTVISLFGISFLIWGASNNLIPLSNFILFFIIVSVFTLPHSIVMNLFYEKIGKGPDSISI